ncbi:MAG: ATP-binding cassette domain-containing protein [Candidatus Eisenbacteria bacterium]
MRNPTSDAPVVPIATPAALEWCDVSLDLGEFAIQEVSLRVEPGQWLCIVGSTGAGKTLLLEVAAGFLRPGSGRVLRNGQDITTLPPERRRVAYVPQDDLLFPHLDVRSNLLFGARRRDTAVIDRLARIAEDLGIAHLLRRKIDAISGGEAQRIALGRALLLDLDLLLLDECTSALDEETREIIGAFLAAERRSRNLSVVQVTHDSAEARRLADVIVSMDKGRLVNRETGVRTSPVERIGGIG